MARGGYHVVRKRGGQTQYSSTSLKHHTPRGKGWSQDGVVAARGKGFAQRGGQEKLSARRGGQILRRSGTGGASPSWSKVDPPPTRATPFLPSLDVFPCRAPWPFAVFLPSAPRGGHPGGRASGPSRAAGCSACRSRAVAARRGRTHPFCPRSKSSPPFPLGPSRFSCPAQPGGVIRAEGPRPTVHNRRAARAKVAFGRPRAATGRRRAVRGRQGEASGAARGGGWPGWVVGRRGRAGGGVAARLGRGEAQQQVPQRRLAGHGRRDFSQRSLKSLRRGRKRRTLRTVEDARPDGAGD